MFMRIMHSAPTRIAQGLAGIWLFVEGGVAQGLGGLALMAAGYVLVVTAGADVCPFDAVFGRPAAPHAADDHHAETAVDRAA